MAGDTDLIAAIYDAVIEPSSWDDAGKRIAEATKSVAGGVYTRLADAADLSAMCNCDPFFVDAFAQHYYKISRFNAAARLKITELTARAHAKRIFEKTETHGQTELIRRFFETALPGSPSGI